MLFFIGDHFLYLNPADGTKLVSFPQPGTAFRARELDTLLQVLDGYQSLLEVDIAYLNSELRRFGTEWLGAQKVILIVDDIDGLRKHVQEGGAESTDF